MSQWIHGIGFYQTDYYRSLTLKLTESEKEESN